MRCAMLMLLAALPLGAQDAAVNALLERIRAHMAAMLARQPNYTCTETVERSSRGVHDKEFRVEDVVKLEVALVDGKEMFAWPGSKQFEDTDMRNFVPTGMFGNGDFGLYANTVFAGLFTTFEFQGQAKLGTNLTMVFDYRVPAEDGIRIRSQDKVAESSFHGSFYAEAGTMDVLRLEVQADQLPKNLDLSEVTDTMEYARVKIGSGDFLLPLGSEAVMISLHGDASRNRTRFSECHEFTGESTLKFGDEDAGAAAAGTNAPAPKQEIRLPRNTELVLRLVDEIDTERAVVGEVVHAALNSDVKVKGQVLLPKGAAVSGRIVRLEHYTEFTVLGLMFEEVESEKAHAVLNMTFDSAEGADVLKRGVPWGTHSPVRPHEGLVPLRPGRFRLGRGVLLLWRT